jgi:hypothetical protein
LYHTALSVLRRVQECQRDPRWIAMQQLTVHLRDALQRLSNLRDKRVQVINSEYDAATTNLTVSLSCRYGGDAGVRYGAPAATTAGRSACQCSSRHTAWCARRFL